MNTIHPSIESFDFWRPVSFTNTPGTSLLGRIGWQLGSWADCYASLQLETLQVQANHLDEHGMAFELKQADQPKLLTSALKLSTYVLSAFFLPLSALVVKCIFKAYLNQCAQKAMVTPERVEDSNFSPLPDVEMISIPAPIVVPVTTVAPSPNTLLAEKQIGQTKLVLLSGSLIEETTDVIVNAANARLAAGSGVCGAIRTAAGAGVFNECQQILDSKERAHLNCGKAVITSAGKLAKKGFIKAIVHAVGPDCRARMENRERKTLLTDAYKNSLSLLLAERDSSLISDKAKQTIQKPLRSISFASMSTGIFKYPMEEAAATALQAIKSYIEEHPGALDEVRLVFIPADKDPQKTSDAYCQALENL